jgi:uncharacterized membrane protein
MEQQYTPPYPATSQVNMGKWISEGWKIVESDLGFFFLLGFIYAAVLGVAAGTGIGFFILDGPLRVGFFYIIFQKMRGQRVDIGMLGKGFDFFAAAALSSIVISVFVGLGFIFCIIPGIVLLGLYMFAAPFVLEQKLDFWQAMEASRQVIKPYMFEFTIFVLVQALVIILGLMFCFVGLFIAIPVCIAATAAAYRDMVGITESQSTTV